MRKMKENVDAELLEKITRMRSNKTEMVEEIVQGKTIDCFSNE